jgi:hypothetical protein
VQQLLSAQQDERPRLDGLEITSGQLQYNSGGAFRGNNQAGAALDGPRLCALRALLVLAVLKGI